ncbi:MAG: flagellar basal body-associated FliL family protein, partial [Thermodesulfovibrio sp.]
MPKETAKLQNNENEAKQQPEKPKKKSKFLFLIIAIVLVGGAAGAYFFLLDKGKGTEHTKSSTAESQGVNFALEPFVVNLMDQGGTKYLKVTVQLELS